MITKKDMLKVLIATIGFAQGFVLNTVAQSNGSRNVAPYSKECAQWSSADQFVGKSLNYCLKTGNSRLCEKISRQYFSKCEFQGDYDQISVAITSKLLVMMVINQAAPSQSERTKEF